MASRKQHPAELRERAVAMVDRPGFLGGGDLWESWGLMASRKALPAELRERAVAMVFELRAGTGNARGSIARVGQRLDTNTETLRNWMQKAETDSGQPDFPVASPLPASGKAPRTSRRAPAARNATSRRGKTRGALSARGPTVGLAARLPRNSLGARAQASSD